MCELIPSFPKTTHAVHEKCAIPVFEGLLPEPHNQRTLVLLFIAAHWHSLAKLRMHNDATLDIMDTVTTSLGDKLREFNERTCSAFVTRELEREFTARVRREYKHSAPKKGPRNGVSYPGAPACHSESRNTDLEICDQQELPVPAMESEDAVPASAQTSGNARRLKTLNLNTYKVHSLGDYTAAIRRYGTTDSYLTEPVRKKSSEPLHVFNGLAIRVNWNIAYQRPDIIAPVANTSPSRLRRSSDDKIVFDVSANATRRPGSPATRKFLAHLTYITELENRRISPRTFPFFYANTRETLPSMYEFPFQIREKYAHSTLGLCSSTQRSPTSAYQGDIGAGSDIRAT
jgi:hypothetical protein